MRIGYACLNVNKPSNFRSCRVKTVEERGIEHLQEIGRHNWRETLNIIKWNVEHNIFFYRLSSDIIPLATHPIQTWDWKTDAEILQITNEIRSLKKQYHLRLSCHPGQYDVLNSPKEEVVKKTKEDLQYHKQMMDLIEGDDIILHVGGIYGNKPLAMQRFVQKVLTLPPSLRSLLRIENDDKSYTIHDIISIHEKTGLAICFDYHHHRCHQEKKLESAEKEIIWNSWKPYGTPKVHISSGKTNIFDRGHNDYILQEDWEEFLSFLEGKEVDVMVEAKKKDLAVQKIFSYKK